MNEELEQMIDEAKACAAQYSQRAVVVRSDVMHDHEELFNWCLEQMRSTLYPDSMNEYWRVVAVIQPNGSVEVADDPMEVTA